MAESPASRPGPPPKPQQPMPDAQPAAIRYLEAYGYIFQNPNWAMNVLFASVCALIPVIGGLIVQGYQFEIVESLHRQRGRQYPDFDFNRFADYLVRGLWPFLVYLVFQFIVQIVITPVMYCVIFALLMAASAAGEEAGGILIVVGMAFIVLLSLAITVTTMAVLTPMLLRAGLAQDFVAAFKFSWIWDFIKRVWLELVLATLFMTVTSMLLFFVGAMVFCIGAVVALAVVVMAQGSIYFQLYRLYLARGGEPIPLKEPPLEATPV